MLKKSNYSFFVFLIISFLIHLAATNSIKACNSVRDNLPTANTKSEQCVKVLDGEGFIPIADFSGNFGSPDNYSHGLFRKTGVYNNKQALTGTNLRGHNGLDMGGNCAGAYEDANKNLIPIIGKDEVHSLLDGVVILSYQDDYTSNWGETVCIASRANEDSEEIITSCYHHMPDKKRFAKACDIVKPNDLLGLEGNTGFALGGASHLHLTLRRWDNLKQLREAINYNKD